MNFVDHSITPLKDVSTTPEGYIVAEAFAVRTGLQRYLGKEVGRPDLQFVDVYRPEEEVFSKDSVSTFAHAPITVDHPAGGVNAATWKQKAVGEVSTEAMRDGERLKLQLVVKDSAATELVKSGAKRQLSAGYTCDLDWTAGTTADGKPYQAVQRKIRINHLALVERGRAGNCQIGDSEWGAAPLSDADPGSKTKENTMTTKPVVLGDKAVQVLAEDAQAVTDFLAKLNGEVATATTAVQTKDGEIAALKQQLADAQMTPEKLNQMVAARKQVLDSHKALTGKDADATLSDADIRKVAVTHKLGDAVTKDMSDAAIEGAFQALTAAAPKRDALADHARGGLVYNDMNTVDLDAIFAASGVAMKSQKEA